jgi:hypothetical protein
MKYKIVRILLTLTLFFISLKFYSKGTVSFVQEKRETS